MESLLRFLRSDIQGVSVREALILVGILFASFVVRRVFQSIMIDRFRRFANRTETDLDDRLIRAVERPVGLLIILFGLHVGLGVVGLPTEPVNVKRFFEVVLIVLVTLDVTWLLIRLTDAFAVFLARLTQKTDSNLDDQLVPLIRKAIKVGLVVVAFVLLVQNMGYQVTGLLAGLGIGGLAFALAAQSSLANLFGSITIILDRPFKVGDLVEGSGFLGNIEEIGLRSTRIRTLEKSLVTVPNSVLANMIVDNLSERPLRRVKFMLGVTYETAAEEMEKAVPAIRAILEARSDVDPESINVRFSNFGESSLDILVLFLTTKLDYASYMQVVEEVNLAIMRAVADLGLEVAFPTRTLYMRSEGYWGDPARAEIQRSLGG